MKKNWIFVILSVAVLFSLGFLPGPVSKTVDNPLAKPTASNALVELRLVNPTQYKAEVLLFGAYYVLLPPKSAKTIKVKPEKYWVEIRFATDKCSFWGKNMKITKKTRLTVVCRKPK